MKHNIELLKEAGLETKEAEEAAKMMDQWGLIRLGRVLPTWHKDWVKLARRAVEATTVAGRVSLNFKRGVARRGYIRLNSGYIVEGFVPAVIVGVLGRYQTTGVKMKDNVPYYARQHHSDMAVAETKTDPLFSACYITDFGPEAWNVVFVVDRRYLGLDGDESDDDIAALAIERTGMGGSCNSGPGRFFSDRASVAMSSQFIILSQRQGLDV